jgi:hypothetical protein
MTSAWTAVAGLTERGESHPAFESVEVASLDASAPALEESGGIARFDTLAASGIASPVA